MKKITKNWIWTTWVAFVLAIIGIVLLIGFSMTKGFNDWNWEIDPQLADYFGSLIGGVVGSMFSLAGIFLLYETILKQQETFNIQHFESRFFELVRYHRDNVQQMNYLIPSDKDEDTVSGAAYFAEMEKEYDKLYEEIKKYLNDRYSEEELMEITMLVHFFGVSRKSIKTLTTELSNYDKELISGLINKLRNKKAQYDRNIVFYGGHQHRLSHYYRHLAQIIKFVDKAKFLSENEKYEYVKLIRAQITQYELRYFFYNSLCKYGKGWKKTLFIDKYQLIKNLPKELGNQISPKKYYPNVVFDWEEK